MGQVTEAIVRQIKELNIAGMPSSSNYIGYKGDVFRVKMVCITFNILVKLKQELFEQQRAETIDHIMGCKVKVVADSSQFFEVWDSYRRNFPFQREHILFIDGE